MKIRNLFIETYKNGARKKKNSKSDFLLFEGAGGLMVPIERKKLSRSFQIFKNPSYFGRR